MNYHSIAIDGPSGAGKSTLARMLAQELGYLYVDTGAIYRTVGLCAFRKGVEPTDARAVTALLDGMEIDLRYEQDGVQHMYLDGEDVTREIRRHEISRYASDVSAIPAVRAFLLERQRELARRGDVIMDGRDIGTVVFPDAELKLFMTADTAVRACRRYKELTGKGMSVTMEEVERNIRERDKADMSRAVSPLRQADDAIVLDNSHMSVDEQMAWFMNEFQLKMKN
mgnify:CR=1 FL=1